MLVFGLTGGIATGKSTVERLLGQRGVPVLDADLFARKVVEPGRPALEEIAREFGPEVLAEDGALDRAALGRRVFHDPEARRRLEAITHPRIWQAMAEEVAGLAARGHRLAVVSAALMVETGSYRNYAGLVVVACSPEQQRARLMARDGLGPEEADARIRSQAPLARKVALADRVVDNGGPPEALEAQVDALVAWMRGRAEGEPADGRDPNRIKDQ